MGIGHGCYPFGAERTGVIDAPIKQLAAHALANALWFNEQHLEIKAVIYLIKSDHTDGHASIFCHPDGVLHQVMFCNRQLVPTRFNERGIIRPMCF